MTDPRAMRALAHPVRLAIFEVLHSHGTANATECAREVGESPQACSYHLRALAKWGFIRNVESDDGRETRWAPAARAVQFSSAPTSPELHAATALLQRRVLERDERAVADYLEHEAEFDEEWRDAATFSSGVIHVTAEELGALVRKMNELLKPYAGRTRRDRPEEARRVYLVLRAVPRVAEPDRKEK